MAEKTVNIVKQYDRSNTELYKELEIINFKEQLSRSLQDTSYRKRTHFRLLADSSKRLNRIRAALTKKNRKLKIETQFELFQKSMKVLLVCGLIIGVNPVIGILESNAMKMRFTIFSLRFIYSFLIFVCQASATVFCIYRLFRNSVNITLLSFVSFYLSTAMTTLLFLRVAAKWPGLMKDIVNSSLDKYIDLEVKSQLVFRSSLLLALALVEHILSLNTKLTAAYLCPEGNSTIYEEFIDVSFPWYAELDLPFYTITGIFLQLLNVTSTINWSYSDVIIVCTSYYLTSVLKQINKTIVEAEKKYYQPSFWGALREDYTRACRLVSSFDDAISGIIFCSFATNLFFICLQLFYVFSHGVKGKTAYPDSCLSQENGPFYGYENFLYFVFSFAFVLCRFLAVSLKASCIHSVALSTAPALYNLPSTVYCVEIQRFLEQVHGNTVALTGLKFFNVTKSLLLTVAGTIITYELVLIQFNGENTNVS